MAETLTELSQRNEAFWIGLALFLLGVVTTETLFLEGIELSRTLIWIGGGILMVRKFDSESYSRGKLTSASEILNSIGEARITRYRL